MGHNVARGGETKNPPPPNTNALVAPRCSLRRLRRPNLTFEKLLIAKSSFVKSLFEKYLWENTWHIWNYPFSPFLTQRRLNNRHFLPNIFKNSPTWIPQQLLRAPQKNPQNPRQVPDEDDILNMKKVSNLIKFHNLILRIHK